MFDFITDKFIKLQRKILGYGKLSDKEINDALREIRMALLEADVNYKVVGEFIKEFQDKLATQKLKDSLDPKDFINVALFQELVNLLGKTPQKIKFTSQLTIIALVGLQGSGKTTTAAKIAQKFKNKNPLLVACDTKRPAASEQLKILATKISVGFFDVLSNAVLTCQEALNYASRAGHQLIIIDTAGRIHIDNELMEELVQIKHEINPHYVILVVDGMIGQDAINQASEFHKRLGLSGIIMTKLDGDAKGGAVISIRKATGVPVYYIGVGEGVDDLEEFIPERMAMRILGRGDILTIQEKVMQAVSPQKQQEIAEKFLKGKFDLNDFLEQLQAIRKMGNINKLIELVPFAKGLKGVSSIDEEEFKRTEAIILSMTKEERKNPEIIDGSRRRRIAYGSGTTVEEVNRLLKEYQSLKRLMSDLKQNNLKILKRLR
ncbi:MAG: signal recognition particle protein [candidate division WOR-3 bacterium]|nr:signal recognition particle protein [candidate division WOR-3 bacterium]